MGKMNLKASAITAVGWLALSAATYFIVGVYLLTDGTNFDPVKVYDLLKDTLALAAAFLAPIAAFVLFRDWRLEHSLIRNEDLSMSVYGKVVELKGLSYQCFAGAGEDMADFDKKVKTYINLLGEIRGLAANINGVNEDALRLKERLEEFNAIASSSIKYQIANFYENKKRINDSNWVNSGVGGQAMLKHAALMRIITTIEVLHV